MTDKKTIAFLGLGVMGAPMAGHLATAGHELRVFNRSLNKTAAWNKQYGGSMCMTPAEAATGADMVVSCVGNDDDVRDVYLGDNGALGVMQTGTVLIDHTTASADVARELGDAAKAKNIGALDAPVSGGQAGAENGQLTIMVGGDAAAYDTAETIMQTYAKSVRLMGPAGSGQLTKMVNQICIGGLIQGLAEAVHFSQKAGLDTDAVFDVISKGAAQSWQMENRAATMAAGEFEFGFAVDWMRKDFAITLDEARRNGAQLPVTALVDQFYADIQKMGGNRWDTSSLIKRLTD